MKSFSIEFSTLDTIFLILAVGTGNLLLAACYLLVCYACGQFKPKPTMRNRTLERCQQEARIRMDDMLGSDGDSAVWRNLRDWRVYSKMQHYIRQLGGNS